MENLKAKLLNKKTLIGCIVAAAIIILLLIILIVKNVSKSDTPSKGDTSSKNYSSSAGSSYSSSKDESSNSSSSKSSSSSSSSSSSKTTGTTGTSSKKPTANKGGTTSKTETTTEGEETPTDTNNPATPAAPTGDEIIAAAVSNIKALGTPTAQASAVANPVTTTLQVSADKNLADAAAELAAKIKKELGYDNYHVNNSAGDPILFDYDYKLTSTGSTDGKNNFKLEYRLKKQYYALKDASGNELYNTDQIVSDICAYLNGKGLKKYDYQIAENKGEQTPTPVPLSMTSRESAASMIKSLADFTTDGMTEYDFVYCAPCETFYKGQMVPGLMFYLYLK